MKAYSSRTSSGRTSGWLVKHADRQKALGKSCKAKARQESKRICKEY